MRVPHLLIAALGAAMFLAACKEPIPHSPASITIVSGSNQIGDVSKALDSALVVQVLDAAKRPVSGVQLSWTAIGGGSVDPASTITDNDGRSSVTWTLAPVAGTQVATVSSSQLSGVSVSFVASNGATISGTITSVATTNPFATFSRTSAAAARPVPTSLRRFSSDRIIVGFKNNALGVAPAASAAYRSMTVARDATGRIQQTLTVLSKRIAIDAAQISPALLAARVRVIDTTQIDAVMAALRDDANVAWVERDGIVSIRDGAPRPVSAQFVRAFDVGTPNESTPMVATRYPNDPSFYRQLWSANMIDLPRAWAITTGSPSIIVASVDMGIRFDHPEISANLTTDGYDFVSQIGFGTTETICDGPTFTTIDGDGDGPDPDPTDPDDVEFNSSRNCWQRSTVGDHGLWTAGLIGAAGNDGRGMTGAAWSVRIRPIRVLGITGDGSIFDVTQGILYAAGLPATGPNGTTVQAPSRAHIINVSLGGTGASSLMANAVAAATAAGSLIVASAGNSGRDFPNYPAAYPDVLAVSAVGMDGQLATYSNAGTHISVSAPGGDFRLDDNGGGGLLGPGWDFVSGQPVYLFGYGTSGAAPYVSGIAALVLSQTPTLSPTDLRARIEKFALRPEGATRSDTYGWGIANAYNALTQQNGPPRTTMVRLVSSTTGATITSKAANSDGTFTFARVANGAYFVQAGDDESSDRAIGVVGRRFGWAGGFGAPTLVNVTANARSVSIALGLPAEVEPNDDVEHANFLTADSWVIGNITTPDPRDVYRLTIATAGAYTIETSGLVGSCGLGVELDTFVSVTSQSGQTVASNDDTSSPTGQSCSRIATTLTPGIYYVAVTPSTQTFAHGTSARGRYRLQVRTGN